MDDSINSIPINSIDDISKELDKINVETDRIDFSYYLSQDDKTKQLFLTKIQTLVNFILKIGHDCTASREAFAILRKLNDEYVFNCLVDNDAYFTPQRKILLTPYRKIVLCLNAALVGSKKVMEILFDEDCNPKENTYIISYVICFDDSEWVKQLVEKWDVNILDRNYCFLFYSTLMKNQVLLDYYTEKSQIAINQQTQHQQTQHQQTQHQQTQHQQTQHQQTQHQQTQHQQQNIQHSIHNQSIKPLDELILQELEILKGITEENIKQLLLNALFNPNYSTLDVANYASSIYPIIGNKFSALYCCKYPKKWDEEFMNTFKETYINNHTNLLPASMIYEHKILWLKLYAHRFILKFLKDKI